MSPEGQHRFLGLRVVRSGCHGREPRCWARAKPCLPGARRGVYFPSNLEPPLSCHSWKGGGSKAAQTTFYSFLPFLKTLLKYNS